MPTADTSENKNLVVPSKLPENIEKVFMQAFHESQFEKGFERIIQFMDKSDENPTAMADKFLKKYEKQVKKLRPTEIEAQPHAFRAGAAWMMLRVLPRFRMDFADKGYNFIFLETHLMKKIVCEIQGLSVRDINTRIRNDGHRPKVYLDDQMKHLVPETFLANLK